jgi:hypothetical protein
MGKVSIGTDPEAFLFHNDMGKIIPACGLIGGTKRKPLHYSKKLNKGFTVQEDNVLVEFNIPPAFSIDQWMDYMNTAMVGVQEYIASRGPYSLKFLSQHKFPNKDLQMDQAMAFGCSPDFNAYDNGAEFKSIDPHSLSDKQGGWRLSGGHIHVGYEAYVPAFVAAAFADYFIGMCTVGVDGQEKRRNLYGQPGRYRPTSYGIEYRTPSNYWLRDYNTMHAIGSGALALGNYLQNTPITRIRNAYQKMPWGAVRKAISEQDTGISSQVQVYITEPGLIGDGL